MSEKATPPIRSTADRPSAPTGRLDVVPQPIAGTKSGSRTGGGVYISAWGVLAMAAGLYLSAIVFKPPFLADWLPTLDGTASQPQGNDPNKSATNQEAKHLRANLEQAQAEVVQLRTELGSRDARVKSAELRIAGLEKELESVRGGTSNPPSDKSIEAHAPGAQPGTQSGSDQTQRTLATSIGSPTTTSGPAADETAPPRKFEIVNGAPVMVNSTTGTPTFADAPRGADVELPLPERRPTVFIRSKVTPIAQIVRPTVAVTPTPPAAGGIETGSVAGQSRLGGQSAADKPTEPIAFGTPTVTRSASSVGIRLTAGPSVDALRLSWSLMSERYAYELKGLAPRYVAGGTPAAPYSLVAGPISDENEAHRRCALLISRGIPCSVDSYSGNAL